MKLLTLYFFVQLSTLGIYHFPQIQHSQECVATYDSVSKQAIYIFVEHMPQYPGGQWALMQYLTNHFKPSKQDYFQANFMVEFVVDKKGKVIAPRIKGKSKEKLTKTETKLLQVLKKMPVWTPGKCNQQNVATKMFLPLKF